MARQRRSFSEMLGGHLRGHLVRAGGKAEERIMRTAHGGCTLSHATGREDINNRNHEWEGGANHLNSDHLIKAWRDGDWANRSSRCDNSADVGSPITLSKSFLKGTSTVDRGRDPAPKLDGLRTARRLNTCSSRSVGICFYLDGSRTLPLLAQAACVSSVGRKPCGAAVSRFVAEHRFG